MREGSEHLVLPATLPAVVCGLAADLQVCVCLWWGGGLSGPDTLTSGPQVEKIRHIFREKLRFFCFFLFLQNSVLVPKMF